MRFLALFTLLFSFFLSSNIKAMPCVEVGGSASLEGVDKAFARQMAIRDALEVASMQSNMQVISRNDTENFRLKNQSSQFVSRSKIENFGILDEYEDEFDNRYKVELRVCLQPNPSGCKNILGGHYQNRIVIAPVVIENPYEARDIANLLPGYQNELFLRLKNQGYQNLEVIDYAQGIDAGSLVSPNLSSDVLNPIQDQTGAQFMLASVIRSASAHSQNKELMDKVRRYYDFEVKDNYRYVEVEWYLIDLNKHRIAAQARHGYEVKGAARVGRDRPFGTATFFKTHTGRAFNLVLDQQVGKLVEHMDCELLETQIIDVRNNEYVLFLSEESKVQVGDQLAVYRQSGNPVRFQGRNLGLDNEPAGFLKIKRIMPKFAVGELVSQTQDVEIGDLVRSW